MQNELLDITIIGCLVLLFASTYRKRATPMVRSWTLGWLLILVHFTALLFHPHSLLAQNILVVTSIAALIACGIVFLLAAGYREGDRKDNLALPIISAAAGIVFIGFLGADVTAPLAYYLCTLIITLCWLAYCLRLPRISNSIRSALTLSTIASTFWLLWTIDHSRPEIGLSAILSQIYLLVGIVYIGTFRRLSGGTLTVVFGLLAWAAVFPAAAFCEHLGIITHISPEFWNVPKYFVAFGMILTLLEEEILTASHQANHDQLTGLPNRAWLEARLRRTLNQSGNAAKQSALLCIDVDRFKHINDTYGHNVGDVCLREVARRLSLQATGMHAAARVGGEEFSLLLYDISGIAQAEQIATDVLHALSVPIPAHGYCLEITASIGIALFPEHGYDDATLWRNADSAMYRAKRAGGNQYLCMSSEIGRLASEANEMELLVRQSLRDGGFELHYQPLYTIGGEVHSLEALVRLRHPEYGLIAPTRFITIAEDRGLIVPLGNWVLDEVCAQSARWQKQGLPPVRIDVNISPLQITRPDFASHVLRALATHDIDPHLLGMEITETAVMRNLAEASRQIDLLAKIGIAFSIDDFGTGYSSLGQLDKLSVQSLKIDRTFVDRICNSGGTYSIVNAIVSVAHSLDLSVVAEGVESQEQWACLRHLGCDIVQGYLFSQPVPAEEVGPILLNGLQPQPVEAR
jgi:diguanylate cyclase (GGDEF)-like protein